MITAVVEVQGHVECLLVADSSENLKRQFSDLCRRARTDGYHASLYIISSTLHGGLDNSTPVV